MPSNGDTDRRTKASRELGVVLQRAGIDSASHAAKNLQPLMHSLNDAQLEAIVLFSAADNELCLLQGPPGTGKTAALVALLALLGELGREQRTLVCAPSNRAVHEILARFLLVRICACLQRS